MKRILSSILAGSLLATLAVAQSSRADLIEKSARQSRGHDRHDGLVYVITV